MKIRNLKFKILLITLGIFSVAYATRSFALTITTPTKAGGLNSGLAGWWTFDGKYMTNSTSTDTSGNSNNATLANMTTASASTIGELGQALKFNGTNNYVDIPDNPSLHSSTGAMVAWVKTTVDNDEQLIGASFGGSSGSEVGIELGTNASGFCTNEIISYFVISVDGETNSLCYTSANRAELFDGKWHQVAVVVNSDNTVSMYLDGVSKTVTVGSGVNHSLFTSSVLISKFRIGDIYLNNTDDNLMNGSIDDARIYNRPLSATDVRQLYNLGAAAHQNVTPTKTVSLNSGLVGWWTFDGKNIVGGKIKDTSGGGNDGVPANIASSTFYSIGKLGQAVNFDGVDDKVDVGDMTSLEGASTATWSFWVKPSTLAPSQAFFSKYVTNDGSQVSWWIGTGQGGPYGGSGSVEVDFSSSDCIFTSSSVLATSTWTHVVVRYDGSGGSPASRVHIYANGVDSPITACNGASGPATLAATVSNAVMGATANGQDYFKGILDDVRVYNRALSATEALQLYNQGAGTKQNVTPTKTVSLNSGLVGWWTFDGKNMTNSTSTDSSGDGFNGTLTSMTTVSSATSGKIGQALNFGAVNSYVLLPVAPTVTPSYTQSFWFYPKVLSTNQGLLLHSLLTPGNGIFLTSGNFIEIDSQSSGNFRTFCNKTFGAGDLNKWWHVSIVISSSTNASQWKCYLNGVDIGLTGSDSSGTYGNPVSTNWTIGAYYNNSWWFNGKMDDVRVYNRALSATEALQLYNLGR